MLSYSAWYYGDSRLQRAIFDAQGLELDALRVALLDVLKQFYVDSASWGLERWEKELSITPPDRADLELRRSLVRSKLLRPPTVTPRWLQEIANQFVQGKTARIAEVPGTYTFILDVPIDDILWCSEMRKAVEAMKPAHLAMYLLFKLFHAIKITYWAQMQGVVSAKYCFWNRGTAKLVKRDAKYRRNAAVRRNRLDPDTLYRTRQHLTAAMLEVMHSCLRVQCSGVAGVANTSKVRLAVPIALKSTAQESVSSAHPVLPTLSSADCARVNIHHSTNHRTANTRSRTHARDGMYKRCGRFVKEGFMDLLGTFTPVKNGVQGRVERI